MSLIKLLCICRSASQLKLLYCKTLCTCSLHCNLDAARHAETAVDDTHCEGRVYFSVYETAKEMTLPKLLQSGELAAEN